MKPKDHYNNTYNYEQEPYNDMQIYADILEYHRVSTAFSKMQAQQQARNSSTNHAQPMDIGATYKGKGKYNNKDTQDTVNKDTKAKVQHRLDMAIPSREQCSTKERAKEKDHHHGKAQP